MDKYTIYETYEEYDVEFNAPDGRRLRRRSKPRRKPKPAAQRAALTDLDDHVEDFVPSYAAGLDPQHHERRWLIESVAPFYRDNIITDVTRIVKGGKEANVYVCTAHPATGLTHVAAKLYRPRELRHLRNDAVYKAGRQLRDEEGKQMKGRRVKLALRKKTRFGKHVDIQWWIGNEFATQKTLFEAGADVPRPIAHQGNTILMAFVGDAQQAAPPLSEVRLAQGEAMTLFARTLQNVALMLDHHLVHGDLSAYNILYWEGAIQIIDFPQMVDARTNPHAFELLLRDVTRVVDYYGRYGVQADALRLTLDLWEPYMGPDGTAVSTYVQPEW